MKNILFELTPNEVIPVSGGQENSSNSGARTIAAVTSFIAAEMVIACAAFFIGKCLTTNRPHSKIG